MEEKLLVDNKKMKLPLVPTIFLIFTIVLGLWLFGINYSISSSNEKLQEEINMTNTAIENFRKDKKIQVVELLENYKSDILKYEKNSDLVKYIEHMEEIEKKYKLSFSGFSFSEWEIKSEILVRKIDVKWEDDAYLKVSKFIKNYREDENSLFELKFINSFEWMNDIKFNVNFKIKNTVQKANLDDNKKENE